METLKEQMVLEEPKETLNAQIRTFVIAKAQFQRLLVEVRANLAVNRQELREGYRQENDLDEQRILEMMHLFERKQRLSGIMCQDMCANEVVGNIVLANDAVPAPATMHPELQLGCVRGSGKCAARPSTTPATLMHRSSVEKWAWRAHEIDAREDKLVVSRASPISNVRGVWLVQVHSRT